MGLLRKTASIGTLGIVKWRSASELLESEQIRREVVADELVKTEAKLERTSRKAKKAARKVERAELEQLKLVRKLNSRRALRKQRRHARDLIKQSEGSAKTVSWLGRRRARKAASKVSAGMSKAAETVGS